MSFLASLIYNDIRKIYYTHNSFCTLNHNIFWVFTLKSAFILQTHYITEIIVVAITYQIWYKIKYFNIKYNYF